MSSELRYYKSRFPKELRNDHHAISVWVKNEIQPGYPLHYFTFLDDDYSEGFFTLFQWNEIPPMGIIVTAPKKEIIQAVIEIIYINSHLKLSAGNEGYDGEDFIKARKSIQLNILNTTP